MKALAALALLATVVVAPDRAFAWGSAGHRMVGVAAIRALPSEVPAFLRTTATATEIGELAREPDRWKDAGKLHDDDRDAAHFIDVDDDGKVLGGPDFAAMPPTRAAYEAQLQTFKLNSWSTGYLQYSIVDGWQQLAKDFAYWRVLKAAEANPRWRAHRAWFRADRKRREALILRDLGVLGHYVGDGSQPLHVSVHFNGWGDYPNPNGYSTAKLHSAFEGRMVASTVRLEAVNAQVAPVRLCDCPIEQRTLAYLAATVRLVEPFYRLEKAGGLAPGDPRGPAFATRQLAIGAAELRDLTVEAWRASLTQKVGWRSVSVADVLDGKADPYPALYGTD